MACDAMARAFGPIEAVPPPPPQSFSRSRYRSLRGKSVSCPQDLNEALHGSSSRSPNSGSSANGQGQRQRQRQMHRQIHRQSSFGSRPSSPGSRFRNVTTLGHIVRQQETKFAPAVPPLPAKTKKVLCPRPINIAAQSKLKMLENLKSHPLPLFDAGSVREQASWKRPPGTCMNNNNVVGASASASASASTGANRCQEVAASASASASGGGSGSGSGSSAFFTPAADLNGPTLQPHHGLDTRQQQLREPAKLDENSAANQSEPVPAPAPTPAPALTPEFESDSDSDSESASEFDFESNESVSMSHQKEQEQEQEQEQEPEPELEELGLEQEQEQEQELELEPEPEPEPEPELEPELEPEPVHEQKHEQKREQEQETQQELVQEQQQQQQQQQEQDQDQDQQREQKHVPEHNKLTPESVPPAPAPAPVPAPGPMPPKEKQSRSVTDKTSGDRGQHSADEVARLEVARLEAETDRILAEQKKLDLARLQAQLVSPPKPKRQFLGGKLSFFSRSKRSTAASSQPTTPTTIASGIFSPSLSHYSRESSLEEPRTPSFPSTTMSFIEVGGKGIVPQTDAPISAINGGERRVIVRCLSSTINLTVTSDTSPLDIVNSASEMTRHHLSSSACVIIECYFVLGLERRLRRYERIRDVMNSWDRDQQNSLLIISCDTTQRDQDLDIESVPRTEEPPSGFSLQMYHSSKPGKWNKRWITLLENGQIYAAKTAHAQPSHKDSSVLCHLTDFDIYSPKESEIRRNLKPPKKFCYAIKSQQKTVVFPNGENFVHFFSTEDSQQAAYFYSKVHGWRSWYMVNRMVDLEKRSKPPQLVLEAAIKSTNSSPKRNSIRNGQTTGAKPSCSVDEGADEPLMDVNEFRISKIVIDESSIQKSLALRSKGSVRTKNAAVETQIVVNGEGCEFSAGGLLGDAYNKRKQNEATSTTSGSKSSSSKPLDGPFTKEPSLLNGGIKRLSSESSNSSGKQGENEEKQKKEPNSWFPSAAEHSARIRHTHEQQRPMTADVSTTPSTTLLTASGGNIPRRDRHPAPLLNFAKDFPEPPRFQNGLNPGVRHAPGKSLINFATGGPVRDSRETGVRPHPPRRGPPPPSNGVSVGAAPLSPQFLPPPPPPGMGSKRQRSKSTVSIAQRRHFQNEAHPVPLMPMRRPHHGEPPSRPLPRCPPEPLVNRAR